MFILYCLTIYSHSHSYRDAADTYTDSKVSNLALSISAILTSIATVRGVDLFPPPVNWLPPNCILEVDDVLQEWTWREPFDLIHLRNLDCAFTTEETNKVYKQCYE